VRPECLFVTMKIKMNNNEKKQEQLGMPFGTANAKLRKMILFQLVQECHKDICYRCNKKITDIKTFSIEHKEHWLDNSVELFWDLENIAFSHLSCNVADARRHKIDYPNGKKWCWRCKEFKLLNLFPKSAKRNRECTSCYSQYRAEYRKKPGKK